MEPEKLVYMANQIGAYFSTQPGEIAPEEIADHLRKFWEPRMRSTIVTYVGSGGDGLDPAVADAVRLLAADKSDRP